MLQASSDGAELEAQSGHERRRKRPAPHAMHRGYRPKQTPKQDAEQLVEIVQGDEWRGREFDIPEDAYGAAILAIVKEMQEIERGQKDLSIVRLIFSLSLLLLNLVLQFFLLHVMKHNMVMPAVNHVQTKYQEFHAAVFDPSGVFQPDLWTSYAGKRELCQIAMTNLPFFFTVLFVWTTHILGEFRTTENLFKDVLRLPIEDKEDATMLVDRQDSDTKSIVALTSRTRVMLVCLVVVPKFWISARLLLIGYQWLSATTSFESLVMNLASMEFVLHVDELLFNAFLPATYRRHVAEINFFVREPMQGQQDAEWEEWKSYVRTFLLLLSAVLCVAVWTFHLQDVLPSNISDVRDHCTRFLQEMHPICTTFDTSRCYPFGNSLLSA